MKANLKKKKGYTVAIENLEPFSKRGNEVLAIIKKLDGFFAIHPHYPDGNILIFETLNDAKIGRNRLESNGVKVGNHICECEVDFAKGEVFVKGEAKEEAAAH